VSIMTELSPSGGMAISAEALRIGTRKPAPAGS
jgi:hypothetical protein